MEVARCILLLPQLFLHLSIYTDLLHLLSFKPIFSCFLQLVSSSSSLVGSVYIFFPFHVPLSLSKHLQVISKHDHTTSHHLPLPAYLLLSSFTTCPSAPLNSSCLPTLHCTLPSPQIFLLFPK